LLGREVHLPGFTAPLSDLFFPPVSSWWMRLRPVFVDTPILLRLINRFFFCCCPPFVFFSGPSVPFGGNCFSFFIGPSVLAQISSWPRRGCNLFRDHRTVFPFPCAMKFSLFASFLFYRGCFSVGKPSFYNLARHFSFFDTPIFFRNDVRSSTSESNFFGPIFYFPFPSFIVGRFFYASGAVFVAPVCFVFFFFFFFLRRERRFFRGKKQYLTRQWVPPWFFHPPPPPNNFLSSTVVSLLFPKKWAPPGGPFLSC